MDSSDEKGSGSTDRGSGGEEQRSCADCRTKKTPLWRGGPSGPKSLCNACGIRYRKRRRETMRSKEEGERETREGEGIGVSLKLRVLEVGEQRVVVKRRSKMAETRMGMGMRMMGEEERAAVLLMALSSGFLYA